MKPKGKYINLVSSGKKELPSDTNWMKRKTAENRKQ